MLRKISTLLLSRFVLLLLAMVIIGHIVFMFYFFQQARDNRISLHRSEVIQKIVNAIYLLEAMPIKDRSNAVAAMSDPNLKITLTAKPTWPVQFTNLSYWKINKALRGNLGAFKLSTELNPNQWLNIQATIYTHYLTKQLILLAIELLVFGSLYLAIWSVYRFTGPLKQFKDAATQLGVNLSSPQLDIYGPRVVRETAHALNQMQLRIQELIRDRTQMLAAISHDLRTPITRLKLLSQFIDDNKLQNTMTHDLDEMNAMITETLHFTREDAYTEKSCDFDLVSLLTTLCDNIQDLGYDINFSPDLHLISFNGRKLAIKRALNNLLQNAARYAPQVKLSIRKNAHHILIKIIDNGPGIADTDLKKVFTPFYRVEKSRSKETGGVGLGLAITKDIIQAHSGEIHLKNIKPHGLRVEIKLPILPE